MPYRLLNAFEVLFRGTTYRHRNQALSTNVAAEFYEDLLACDSNGVYGQRVNAHQRVLSATNQLIGLSSRRGDGTLGPLVDRQPYVVVQGFSVARGPVASADIGVEVKIVAKAMVKQIDRVVSDLRGQAEHFRSKGTNAITIGIVGVNWAQEYTSYEGERSYKTTGKGGDKHPFQEAPTAIRRLLSDAAPAFDEFLILEFLASNEPPHSFAWRNPADTRLRYGAVLTRVSEDYVRRFP